MNPYLETFLSFVYSIFYAIATVLRWLLYPLTPVWYLVYLLSLPFIYIGRFVSTVVTYPARVFPGSTVETLYIYLSIAALIGFLAGGTLYFSTSLLTKILRLDSASIQKPPPPARRTVADFRAARRKKRNALKQQPLADLDPGALSPKSAPLGSPTSPTLMTSASSSTLAEPKGRWSRRGLLSPQTILEEGDSDEYL